MHDSPILVCMPSKKYKRYMFWQILRTTFISILALILYTIAIWYLSGVLHDYSYVLDARSHVAKCESEAIEAQAKWSKFRIGVQRWEKKQKENFYTENGGHITK